MQNIATTSSAFSSAAPPPPQHHLHHQHQNQIPRGVGACPPPGMDPRRGRGKLMCIKVRMLDESIAVFHLGHKATGQDLFDEVCRHLNLLETDYFDLEFLDGNGNKCWVDKEKSILKQITSCRSDARFYFVVKFYTPTPANLEEDYTRYLFSLQIKMDLARGELVCNDSTSALLASFIVQAECGDYSPADYPDQSYLKGTGFVPNQSNAFQIKVMENHRRLIGMTPAEADLAFIETARRCDFYGIKLHSAKDVEGTEVGLSVVHTGIKVFHQANCVATFSWAKIRKLCFKRRRLMIKIHSDSYQCYKETIEFIFDGRNDCKNFWKKCVEHHSFFRCIEPIETKREHNLLFSRGSTFRYHGRTQKQLIDYVREHRKRREPFQRPLHMSSVPREASVASNPRIGVVDPNNIRILPSHSDHQMAGLNNGGELGANGQGQPHHYSSTLGRYPSGAAPASDQPPPPRAIFPSNFNNNKATQGMENASGLHQKSRIRPVSAQQPVSSQFMDELETTLAHRMMPSMAGSSEGIRHQSIRGGQQQQQQQNQPVRFGSAYKNRRERASESSTATGTPLLTNGGEQQQHQQIQMPSGNMLVGHSQHLQQQDLMSTSLPNVLAKDIRTMCTEFGVGVYNIDKSASGENFIDGVGGQRRRMSGGNQQQQRQSANSSCDRFDESDGGSYKCSSITDVVGQLVGGSTMPDQATVYNTTFTTKRVGDVIIKRVNERLPPESFQKQTGLEQLQRDRSSESGFPLGENADSSQSGFSTSSAPAVNGPPGGPGFAPVGGSNNNRIFVNRMRYIDSMSKLRNEVPIPIDGPHASSAGASRAFRQHWSSGGNEDSGYRIIRPVMINEKQLKKPSTPGSSGSGSSRKPIVVVKTGSGTGTIREPVVEEISPTDPSDRREQHEKQQQPKTSPKHSITVQQSGLRSPAAEQRPSDFIIFQQHKKEEPQTSAGDKPIPGRVITRENLMITPDGIDIKPLPAVEKNTTSNGGHQNQQQKPKVPPKPSTKLAQHATDQPSAAVVAPSEESTREGQQNEEVKMMEVEEVVSQNLSVKDSVLDSILNDVCNDMNKVLDELEECRIGEKMEPIPSETIEKAQPRFHKQTPTMVSVECDDRPDVKKIHLFGDIPYTLTVRNLEFAPPPTTAIGGGGKDQEGQESGQTTAKRVDVNKHHHRSFELVQRKRLPSQDSFSSQDHSISPTTPDSGNIIEYLTRRRSLSYEGRGLAAAREKASAAAAKNGGRRMTQPIKPPTSAVDIRFLKTDEKVDRERKQEEGSSICHAMKLESVQLATDEIIVSQEIHVTSEPPATEETEHNKK